MRLVAGAVAATALTGCAVAFFAEQAADTTPKKPLECGALPDGTNRPCASVIRMETVAGKCVGTWAYDAYAVNGGRQWLRWRLLPVDGGTYVFDATQGILLRTAYSAIHDISDAPGDIGHESGDKATFRRLSINNRRATVRFDFTVSKQVPGKPDLPCTIEDPMIINKT